MSERTGQTIASICWREQSIPRAEKQVCEHSGSYTSREHRHRPISCQPTSREYETPSVETLVYLDHDDHDTVPVWVFARVTGRARCVVGFREHRRDQDPSDLGKPGSVPTNSPSQSKPGEVREGSHPKCRAANPFQVRGYSLHGRRYI